MTSGSSVKRDGEALDRFTRATELPLLVLAIAMVPLIVAPLVFDLSDGAERAVLAADWIIWAIFAVELGVRTYLAPTRASYLVHHWYDVVIVAVPFLRPLRAVRSARALRFLRVVRLAAFLGRIRDTALTVLTRHRLDYALATAVLVVFVSAGLMTRIEANEGGSIDSFGAALWWAFVTVTTVGYGDYSPVTAAGRGIAIVLMLLGICLFGIIAANIAAYVVTEQDDEQTAALLEEIHQLRAQVDRLERSLAGADSDA